MATPKIDWRAMGRYVLQRLTERTTWTGVIGLVSAAGVVISPQYVEQIAAVGVSVAGLVLMLWPDKPKVLLVALTPVEA